MIWAIFSENHSEMITSITVKSDTEIWFNTTPVIVPDAKAIKKEIDTNISSYKMAIIRLSLNEDYKKSGIDRYELDPSI